MVDARDDEPVLDLDAETSGPQDRERLVREASALAEARDALYRAPTTVEAPQPWRLGIALVLVLLGTWLLLAPPELLVPPSAPGPTTADRVRGVRAALRIQAEQVEAYRVREGRLPDALDQLPHRFPEIRYVRSNARVYQLVAADPSGDPVLYDSARPDPAFDEAVPWTPEP